MLAIGCPLLQLIAKKRSSLSHLTDTKRSPPNKERSPKNIKTIHYNCFLLFALWLRQPFSLLSWFVTLDGFATSAHLPDRRWRPRARSDAVEPGAGLCACLWTWVVLRWNKQGKIIWKLYIYNRSSTQENLKGPRNKYKDCIDMYWPAVDLNHLLVFVTKASSGRAKLEFLFTKIGVGWKLIWPRDRIDISKERALHPPPPPPPKRLI